MSESSTDILSLHQNDNKGKQTTWLLLLFALIQQLRFCAEYTMVDVH